MRQAEPPAASVPGCLIRMQVVSACSGIVQGLSIGVGSQVSDGQELLQVVPEADDREE